MARDSKTLWRPLAVWLGVTHAACFAGAAVPAAWRALGPGRGPDAVADVLVAGCATVLAAALAWLWVVTTAAVAELSTGRLRSGGGTTRRLVLLACGAAVVAGAGAPAVAADVTATGEGSELLAGLPLPERAVAPGVRAVRTAPVSAAAESRPGAAASYVVRPGDSLWSIARAHPAGVPTDQRWRAIWAANRGVVGEDPDLIHPGQALHLPGAHADPHADPHADKDGDR